MKYEEKIVKKWRRGMNKISILSLIHILEQNEDVTILLDSITRLARAYNMTVPPSGRTLLSLIHIYTRNTETG